MKKGLNKTERYYLSILKANQACPKSLYDCYKAPSTNKAHIDAFIRGECHERNGFGYSILTSTCHFFTCGYFYSASETGELRACIKLPTRTLDFAVVE